MRKLISIGVFLLLTAPSSAAEDLGAMWDTAREEDKYYKLINIPIPPEVPLRIGSFDIHADGRLIAGTRRGDVYFIDGVFDQPPASGVTLITQHVSCRSSVKSGRM